MPLMLYSRLLTLLNPAALEFAAANYLTGLMIDLKPARVSVLGILILLSTKMSVFKFFVPESVVTPPI
jgi:hypothetical protein